MIKGKRRQCLLAKYNIHSQLLGLAPNSPDDTDAPYRLSDIRNQFNNEYAEKYSEIARDIMDAIKAMLIVNISSMKKDHCETCKCLPEVPKGWSIEEIQNFLNIPTEEVFSLYGGY